MKHNTKPRMAAQYIRDGFKASEVGALLGVHRVTVWRYSRDPAYREVYSHGDAMPHMGRFYRTIRRNPDLMERLKSKDPHVAAAAATKLLDKDAMRELLG